VGDGKSMYIICIYIYTVMYIMYIYICIHTHIIYIYVRYIHSCT
jgi:hypothetical protein